MKHAVYFALGGAIITAALTAWLAPGVIAWYFNPPVEMGGFSCTAPIAWALKRLQWAQLWGVIVGSIAGLVVYGFVHRRRARHLEQGRHEPAGGQYEPGPKCQSSQT